MTGMKMSRASLMIILAAGLVACASPEAKKDLENELNPQYQYDKAVIAVRYGLPDRALEYVEAALALDPSHPESLALLGYLRSQAGDHAKAVEALEKSLTLKPGQAEALNRLGSSYQALGESAKAKEAFGRAEAVDGNAFAAFSLARIHFAEKNYPEALAAIDRAAAKSPKEAGVHNIRGVILNQMERYPEAVKSLENAVALSPKDVGANVNLGIALMNNGENARSREVLERIYPVVADAVLKAKVAEYIKAVGGKVE